MVPIAVTGNYVRETKQQQASTTPAGQTTPVGGSWAIALSGRTRSCDFTAHMCTGMILSNYKLFVNPLFELISIEHVIIGSKTQWKTM